MAGYSETPLAKKLGIKENFRVKIENAPGHFLQLLLPLPLNTKISSRLRGQVDIWHIFTRTKKGLDDRLRRAMNGIPSNGIIWVSWPKKASGIASDMTEDEVRNSALPLGLVDEKDSIVQKSAGEILFDLLTIQPNGNNDSAAQLGIKKNLIIQKTPAINTYT